MTAEDAAASARSPLPAAESLPDPAVQPSRAGEPARSRVAVVTGAAGGIGSAICRRLSADGFMVACLDLRAEDAAGVASDLPQARGYGADVRDAASVRAAAGRIRADMGLPWLLVNAAIEGAVAGGATEVVVNDSHYQMRNLPPGALAGQASYISGSHKPLYMMQGLDASFDAVLFVSYHGSVGAPAGLSHTYSPRTVGEARINGTVTGEAGINALVAAHYGVPVVLVTGDRCACEETAALIPGVHTAVVKEHVSRLAAHSLHPARACQLIRETATKAVAGAAAAGPPPYATPVALDISVRNTDIAEAATWVRGVDRAGPRELRIEGDDLLSVYRSFASAILLTTSIAEAV